MGSRGPKAGWKQAATKTLPAPSLALDPPPVVAADVVPLSASDRENPSKLTGEALKDLAHRWGMPRSALDDMSDVRIREQLQYYVKRRREVA